VVAEAADTTPPRRELSKLAIIFDKLEVNEFFFLTDKESFGVLKCMAGGILGVVVPETEDEFGMLGTELAVGKLWLGETGVELTDINEGVVVRF
jgi:hypothetical protein